MRKAVTKKYWVERNGRIYARLQYRSGSGGYKTKYRQITDKRTARSAVEEMRRELELRGEEGFRADKMTFNELADKYQAVEMVEAVYRNGIKVLGRRSIGAVKYPMRWLREYFGDMRVQQIKTSDIKAYKSERINSPVNKWVKTYTEIVDPNTGEPRTVITKEVRSTPRTISTVNKELSLLRAILNFAIESEWLLINPFTKSKGKIISRVAEVERDRILSFEEERRLIAACVGRRAHIRPILICALDTAMRRGEMLKLEWADVDFAQGEITILQTNTKTEKERIVAMTPRLRTELLTLWEASPKQRSLRVFGWADNITHGWTSACRAAGVENFRLHDCRHTATTRMIASGSPHTEVMKITGHSQMKTFLRYLTITTDTATAVASRLGDYLSQSQPVEELTEYIQ